MRIKSLEALEILDSRGNPTVEVDLVLEDGTQARAMVPSGASTGEKEATELRDGDKKRYGGKGVKKAVENVINKIAPEVTKREFSSQRDLDYFMIELDGTPNKSALGANALLGVSMAYVRACAANAGVPLYQFIGGVNANLLPVPCMNIINGGKHADNNVDFQEFMIAPFNAPSFAESIRMGAEVFHSLKSVLNSKGLSTGVGDEGGFAPDLKSNEEAIEVILEAISKAGYKPGQDVGICLDPAASEMWVDDSIHDPVGTRRDNGKYLFFKSSKERKSSDDMIKLWESWVKQYPILSIEDGLAENDWDGWANLTRDLGSKIELVGDDIFCTNKSILSKAIEKKIGNSILIKLNQIGTVTETLETIELAYRNAYGAFVSHRSGETVDTIISDLTVAIGAGHLKTGSASRGERIEKFNQLMRIEKRLGKASRFAGKQAFKNA